MTDQAGQFIIEMAASNDTELPLNECFNKAMEIIDKLEESTAATNSSSYQDSVRNCIELFKKSQLKVAALHLFSTNEELEEVHTNEIKYFLINAFLAEMTSKQVTERSTRLNNISETENFIKEFLNLCKDYELGSLSMIKSALQKQENKDKIHVKMDDKMLSDQRSAKIEKYKQETELKEKLQKMKNITSDDNADDETLREFWLTLIKKWIISSVDLMQSLQQEKEMLAHFKNLENGNVPQQPAPPKKPLKPFILTRDAAQAKVFGTGYPSMPTMTVEEYAELEMKALEKRMGNQQITNTVTTEELSDEESDEKVYKARAMDDWKDTHRRGEGNRKNMG